MTLNTQHIAQLMDVGTYGLLGLMVISQNAPNTNGAVTHPKRNAFFLIYQN
jgi:hypothetical protein